MVNECSVKKLFVRKNMIKNSRPGCNAGLFFSEIPNFDEPDSTHNRVVSVAGRR